VAGKIENWGKRKSIRLKIVTSTSRGQWKEAAETVRKHDQEVHNVPAARILLLTYLPKTIITFSLYQMPQVYKRSNLESPLELDSTNQCYFLTQCI